MRTVDVPFITILYELGHSSGVVDMGMREHKAIDLLGFKMPMDVPVPDVLAFTLEEPAVQ
jgi:hypothetical protein